MFIYYEWLWSIRQEQESEFGSRIKSQKDMQELHEKNEKGYSFYIQKGWQSQIKKQQENIKIPRRKNITYNKHGDEYTLTTYR